MKTAYIELNGTNQICSLGNSREANRFSYKGIHFFPNASVTSLTEILRQDYYFFILDFGVLNMHNSTNFLRCDKSFLVCSPGKWRICQTREKLEYLFKNETIQNRMTVIMNLCEKESFSTSFCGLTDCIPFPYLKNPFYLTPNRFHALSQILERNY